MAQYDISESLIVYCADIWYLRWLIGTSKNHERCRVGHEICWDFSRGKSALLRKFFGEQNSNVQK